VPAAWQQADAAHAQLERRGALPNAWTLGTYSRRNLLYRAFRELGRVERTLLLLRFMSSVEIRRTIRAETTKIGSSTNSLVGSPSAARS
jgi:TnpA family transposase